jgi:hypothetical protein
MPFGTTHTHTLSLSLSLSLCLCLCLCLCLSVSLNAIAPIEQELSLVNTDRSHQSTKRLEALQRFRDRETNFLIATDLASRGLDIIGIATVLLANICCCCSGCWWWCRCLVAIPSPCFVLIQEPMASNCT